jgi:hypothetical protein
MKLQSKFLFLFLFWSFFSSSNWLFLASFNSVSKNLFRCDNLVHYSDGFDIHNATDRVHNFLE